MRKFSFNKTDVYEQFDELEKMVDANHLTMTLLCRIAKPKPISPATVTRWRQKLNPPKTTTLNRLLDALQEILEERKEKTGR